jgi:acetyl esterase/lipase
MSSTDPRLHPDVRAVLAALEEEEGASLEMLPVAEARRVAAEALKPMEGEAEPVGTIEDLRIPSPAGEIPVRVYTPEGTGPFPGLVYFHGGGWVLCDLETHNVVCRAIARRAPAVVVAVDYRLAPEHKFPAAIEDASAATRWVVENAARLNIDPRRIAVGGDSAGGNLAAVVSLKSRQIALQVLVYPVTDLSFFATNSYKEFADGYHLTRSEMEWFRREYLANPGQALDPDASPLLAPDLSGAPPALVITAECDVLRDEGEAYAGRLRRARVPVTLTRYPGMIHPFFSMPGAIRDANVALDEVAGAVRAMPPN